MAAKTETIKVRIDDDLLRRLDDAVAQHGEECTRSVLLREALRRYLLSQRTPDLGDLSMVGEFVGAEVV